MNCNTTHYRANSSSVPGDPTLEAGAALPFALERLRILAPCAPQMLAWVRPAAQGVDIDLCDMQGKVCVQLQRLQCARLTENAESADETFADKAATNAESTGRVNRVQPAELPLQAAQLDAIPPALPPLTEPALLARIALTEDLPQAVPLAKPSNIRLAAPAAAPPWQPLARVPVRLPPVMAAVESRIDVYDHGEGIVALEIRAAVLDAALADALVTALARVREAPGLKVLLLCQPALQGERWSAALLQAYEALATLPCPVIALLEGDAGGTGLLLGALCDVLVCSEEGRYGYTQFASGFFPGPGVDGFFNARLGRVRAQDFLYVGGAATGAALRARGWDCPIVASAQVRAYGRALAQSLAEKPQDALYLLKQHLARPLRESVSALATELAYASLASSSSSSSSSPVSVAPAALLHAAAPCLYVETMGEVALLMIRAAPVADLHAALAGVFAELAALPQYKVLVLGSAPGDFVPASAESGLLELGHLLSAAPLPLIVAAGGAVGAGWYLSQCGDACLYQAQGQYEASLAFAPAALAREMALLSEYRLGEASQEILLRGERYSGEALQQLVGSLVLATTDVVSAALRLAREWAQLPRATLLAWKQQRIQALQAQRAALPPWREEAEAGGLTPDAATTLVLSTPVVQARVHPEGILDVRLEEREARNMFSAAFIAGIAEVFAHIADTPIYKAVILQGYDQYFACGGTKESLVAIQQGRAQFTDNRIYQLALDCRIPVIAAMQGHGLGAGWSLGMFADFVLFSEESHYVSPYMNYGFTPGAGATLILPARLGHDLANASLLTGRAYRGSELRAQGLRFPVLPRAQVGAAALALARGLARHSRGHLIAFKAQRVRALRQALEETYQRELAMHAQTFVGRADTLARIEARFVAEPSAPQTMDAPALKESMEARESRESAGAVESLDSPTRSAAPSGLSLTLGEVIAHLRKLLAEELYLAEAEIETDAQFIDLGLDSITGVTWIRKINETYHTAIAATRVYSYPTLAQLGQYVKEEAEKLAPALALHLSTGSASGSTDREVTSRSTDREVTSGSTDRKVTSRSTERSANRSKRRSALKSWREQHPATRPGIVVAPATPAIAVIGMAGRFPQAPDLDRFWQNLAAGRDCISEVAPERWDVARFYRTGEMVAGKSSSKWLGALEGYDCFDPLFFNISPVEAESMDPQQRLFLQACWHGLEDAGYNPQALSGRNCGVFVGCANGDYQRQWSDEQLSAQAFTGGAASILAARISYFLNLQGPCLSIDTACSSSLVAIANACDSLVTGSSELALAGGVYVMTGPSMHIQTSQAGMLSPDGRCYTFDERANGFVPGEGVGVVVLKRLADALRDQDIVQGVIEGWGVNQDGRTNGITAPNPKSQARLQQGVYDKYGIDPGAIQLVEAHGTGTRLGDPIEIEGLRASFGKYTQQQSYCALGSVKSNIGHCLFAAGIAGFLKLMLALKHRQLPPTIHFEHLNTHIDLAGSPFYINSRLQPWAVKAGQPRRAALSSFGFSGTNAHVIVQEYVSEAAESSGSGPWAIVLSARTAEQLRQKVRDLLAHLEHKAVNLAGVAYTLQVGREAMEERLGLVVESVEQLRAGLHAVLSGTAQGYYQGQVKRNREALAVFATDADLKQTLSKWLMERKLDRLLELWVKGLELEWAALYGAQLPQRVSLPGYPFAQERYWLEPARSAVTAEQAFALERVQVLAPCAEEMLAWVRPTKTAGASPAVDIDLCDEEGRVCVQLQGLTLGSQPLQLADVDLAEQQRAPGEARIDEESAPTVRVHAGAEPLFYQECWQEKPATEVAPPGSGRIILFTTPELHQLISTSGIPQLEQAIVVHRSEAYRKVAPDIYHCRFNDSADLRKLFDDINQEAAANEQPATFSIVYTWARDQQERGIHALFGLFTSIKSTACAISHVTLMGSYDPSNRNTCWDYAWIGFERSLKQLLPIPILILYAGSPADVSRQLPEIARGAGVVWHENARRSVLSFALLSLAEAEPAPILKQQGGYLITGGAGALGLKFARYLAERCQAKLLLTGRSARTPQVDAQLALLKEAGASEVHYQSIDVADLQAMKVWSTNLPFPLSGVIHAAGLESAQAFHERSVEDVSSVLRPKVTGSLVLDEVLSEQPLDFVCYFSSAAALLGDLGSCDYAIANRFQMAYAWHRERSAGRRGRTSVINWPLWKEGGMGFRDSEQVTRYLKMSAQELGQETLATQVGLDIWQRVMRAGELQTLVMVGKSRLVETFLHKTYGSRRPGVQAASVPTAIIPLPPGNLQSELRASLAAILHMKPLAIDVEQPFGDLGLDSFLGLEWISAINKKYGTALSNIIIYDYPNIRDLAEYLKDKIMLAAPSAPLPLPVQPASDTLRRLSGKRRASRAPETGKELVAIVGMSGRYPQADNLRQYWDNIVHGRNSIVEVPSSRWDVRDYFDPELKQRNNIYAKWLGAMDDIDCFDPLFFRISPQEAETMDPQHRLFLQESYRAFEDAGYAGQALSNMRCSVYLGIDHNEYSLLLAKNQIVSGNVTSNSYAIGGARIAYYLNLKGPAISVDTACSSSLVAIHLACQGLLNHETDMALAGGVSVWLSPESYQGMCQAGMLSRDGQCKTFDDSADGIVVGEGVGAVVLKRLRDAEADRDVIHGVIIGSGINQDGKTNGITAPSVNSQIELERAVYSRYGIDPETISYVEAHGTGTKLGDPIELEALATVFRERTSKRNFCALASVKTNIGHTTAAAGVASVHKVLLSMRHRVLAPTLNVRKENTLFDFSASPFYVNKERRSWDTNNAPRRAAVNAFGFSGTNAHLVIEEYRGLTAPAAPAPQGEVMIVLSARKSEQLRQKAQDLLDWIGSGNAVPAETTTPAFDDAYLQSMGYTLQVGRDAMEERLGFIVSSADQLRQKLKDYLSDRSGSTDFHEGRASAKHSGLAGVITADDLQHLISGWLSQRQLTKILELWVNGWEIDWLQLYPEPPQRLSLPTYPFARERYWFESAGAEKPASKDISGSTKMPDAIRHPLLHVNDSNFLRQRYTSSFTGEERFLVQPKLPAHGAMKLFPPAACLEMAREAARRALGDVAEDTLMQLSDVVWFRPILVGDSGCSLSIELLPADDDSVTYAISDAAHAGNGVYSKGEAATVLPASGITSLDLGKLRRNMAQVRAAAALPESDPQRVPLDHEFEEILIGGAEMLIRLTPASSMETGTGPRDGALLLERFDTALHNAIALFLQQGRHVSDASAFFDSETAAYLPFALDSAEFSGQRTDYVWMWLRFLECEAASQDELRLDVALADAEGRIVAHLHGLALENQSASLEYALQGTGQRWLSMVEEWSLRALHVEHRLWSQRIEKASGHDVWIVTQDAADYESIEAFCKKLSAVSAKPDALGNTRHIPIRAGAAARDQRLDISSVRHERGRPLVIFFFLPTAEHGRFANPDLETVYDCIQQLSLTAGNTPLQFYCCIRERQADASLYCDALVGLFKSAMLENPGHRYRSISYDDALVASGSLPVRLIEEWLCDETTTMGPPAVPMVRYAQAERYELKPRKLTAVVARREHVGLRRQATYLMVGALGDVGELICRELGRTCQARLVILSRRSREEAAEALERIERSGASVVYRSVDILDHASLKIVLEQLRVDGIRIHGVVHMARQVVDAPIAKKSFRQFAETMAAKVQGLLNVDSLTVDQPLEFFICYSSMAAFGIKGSPDYAYSTAFQNAFARERNAQVAQGKRRGRYVSICWGQWQYDGAVPAARMQERLQLAGNWGMDAIRVPAAMPIMDLSLNLESDVTAFIAVSDEDKVLEMLGFNDAPDAIRAMTKEFREGRISRAQFVVFLATLDDGELSDTHQKEIVVAIQEFERATEKGRSTGAKSRTGQTRRKQPVLESPQTPSTRKPQHAAVAVAETPRRDTPQRAGTHKNLPDRIVTAVAKVLKLQREIISAETSFQDYGLDSITAVQLTAALEKEFGLPIPPNWLIEYPSVKALATKLNDVAIIGD